MIILKYTLKKSASICKYIVNKIAYICFIFGAGVMIYSEYFVRDRQFDKQIDITELFELISYAVISYIIYTIRYNRAKKSLKLYYMNLRRLTNMYK